MPETLPSLDDIRNLSPDSFRDLQRSVAARQVLPTLGRTAGIAAGVGLSAAGIRHLLQMRAEAKEREKIRNHRDREVRLFGKTSGLASFVSGAMKGEHATSPYHFPLFIPAAGLTAGTAGAAGYLAGSKLLNSLRSAQNKRRLEKAREEYRQALMPAPADDSKEASERCELARDMDRIWAHLGREKNALELTPGLSRALGAAAGLYLLTAAGTMGYGALKGFKSQRANSKTKAVERARLERQLVKEKDQPSLVTVG